MCLHPCRGIDCVDQRIILAVDCSCVEASLVFETDDGGHSQSVVDQLRLLYEPVEVAVDLKTPRRTMTQRALQWMSRGADLAILVSRPSLLCCCYCSD